MNLKRLLPLLMLAADAQAAAVPAAPLDAIRPQSAALLPASVTTVPLRATGLPSPILSQVATAPLRALGLPSPLPAVVTTRPLSATGQPHLVMPPKR